MTAKNCSIHNFRACWVCGTKTDAVWKQRSLQRDLAAGDLQITDSHYGLTLTLMKCHSCGFIFADEAELDELEKLYEKLDDPEYESTQDTRVLQMRWLLDQVQRVRPSARTWLDIGAGAGLLVAEARHRGFEAVGVEPSYKLVAAATKVNSVELLQGSFPHAALAGRNFDVISVVDVIEHVSSPVTLLDDCRNALAPGGILLVVTPDAGSFLARLLGQRWWHMRLAHVGYFDRKSLSDAARVAGLSCLEWFRARWFFRVSYLAERVAVYLPLANWNRLAVRLPLISGLYKRVIAINLFDSWVVVLSAKEKKLVAVENLGESPKAFKDMNSENHGTKPKKDSGNRL